MGEELSTLSIPSPWGAPPPPRMAVRIFSPMVRRLAHGEGEIPCTLQNYSLNEFEAMRSSGRSRLNKGGGVPGGLSGTDPLRWQGVRSYEIDLSCLSQSMKTVEKY